MSDGITPGERRELRSVVKGQYKVLRAEVKRRTEEMKAEIEQDLLDRYREEDAAISAAREEIAVAYREYMRTAERIARELSMAWPDVEAGFNFAGSFHARNKNRTQIHRAAMARIPTIVGNAALTLDRQEVGLLRELSEGALEGASAKSFLSQIPTVGELVPRARLKELESGLS